MAAFRRSIRSAWPPLAWIPVSTIPGAHWIDADPLVGDFLGEAHGHRVEVALDELIGDLDPERSQRAMKAMLGMGKLDIGELRRAADKA